MMSDHFLTIFDPNPPKFRFLPSNNQFFGAISDPPYLPLKWDIINQRSQSVNELIGRYSFVLPITAALSNSLHCPPP